MIGSWGHRTRTSEPKGQELNYSARISLDRTQMQVDDRMSQSVAGHGGDRGNQDRIAHDPELSADAAAAIPAGNAARAVRTPKCR